jgi:hypothetical protein
MAQMALRGQRGLLREDWRAASPTGQNQRHKTQLILSSATQIADRCVASPVLSPSLSVGTPILSRSASQRFVIGWSG